MTTPVRGSREALRKVSFIRVSLRRTGKEKRAANRARRSRRWHSSRQLATLDWRALSKKPYADRLSLTSSLLRIRRERIMPLLALMTGGGSTRFDDGVLSAEWRAGNKLLQIRANLSDQERERA